MGADYTRMHRHWQLSRRTIAQKSSRLRLLWPVEWIIPEYKLLFLWLLGMRHVKLAAFFKQL